MPIRLQPTLLHFLGYISFVVPLILSFLILSILVTPLTHLNILISATSNLFSCAFFTAHVSAPYIIAGLTTVLYTFPLTLKLILRSHRIPDILFQFFHPDCILCVISASKSPFSANVAPRPVFKCVHSFQILSLYIDIRVSIIQVTIYIEPQVNRFLSIDLRLLYD